MIRIQINMNLTDMWIWFIKASNIIIVKNVARVSQLSFMLESIKKLFIQGRKISLVLCVKNLSPIKRPCKSILEQVTKIFCQILINSVHGIFEILLKLLFFYFFQTGFQIHSLEMRSDEQHRCIWLLHLVHTTSFALNSTHYFV